MITVTVPPSLILNANQRLHWAQRRARTATLRARAAKAWMDAGRPQLDRAHLVVQVGYPNRRTRDIHNLMPTVKALIDGVVHPASGVRGLLPDDSDHYLTGPDLRHNPGLDQPGTYTFTLTQEHSWIP